MLRKFLAVFAAVLLPATALGQSRFYVAGYAGLNGNSFSYRTLFLGAPSQWETQNTDFGLGGGVKVGRTGVRKLGLFRFDAEVDIFYISSPLPKTVIGFDFCSVDGFPMICPAEVAGTLGTFGAAPSIVVSVADVTGSGSEFYLGLGAVVGRGSFGTDTFTESDLHFGARLLGGSRLRLGRNFSFFAECQGIFLPLSFLRKEGFLGAPLTTGLEFKSRQLAFNFGLVRYF